ncbi:MAG: ABC-2 family transporter protein [Patescibacteria group bacterium]
MKKYWMIAKLGFQQDLSYRTNFFLFFLRQTAQLLIQILFWAIVFRQKNGDIFGYDFAQTVRYFIFIEGINLLVVNGVDFDLAEAIKSGSLSGALMRPLSVFWAYLVKIIGQKLWWLIYLVVVLAGLLLFGVIHFSLGSWLWLPVVVFNAFLILFLYRFLLGMLAFWLTSTSSVLHLFNQPTQFLGGGWFPLAFLPNWLSGVLKLLPFYLLFGFPAELSQGSLSASLILTNIGKQFFWIVLLFFLVAWVWSRGVKQYEAVGN